MAIERKKQAPQRRGLPRPARVLIGALAVFGTITLVQWIIVSLLGIIKLALLVVVIVAVAGWIINTKSAR